MNRTRMFVAAAVLAAVAGGLVATRLAAADEELDTSTGSIKILTLPLEGPMAGKLYFELAVTQAGAASAFKVDVNNWAAIEMLTSAKAGKMRIRVTYKPDFTVTELEVL